jgi:hypothetical protein
MDQILTELAVLHSEVKWLKDQEVRLSNRIDEVNKKVDCLKTWIMGVMAGVIISILTQVTNFQ